MSDDPDFPADCPVTPLGVASDPDTRSQYCFYRNPLGQIVRMDAGTKHGKNNLIHLFGGSDYLVATWPKWSMPQRKYSKLDKAWIEISPPQLVGFDQAAASAALITACARRGLRWAEPRTTRELYRRIAASREDDQPSPAAFTEDYPLNDDWPDAPVAAHRDPVEGRDACACNNAPLRWFAWMLAVETLAVGALLYCRVYGHG